MSPSRTRRSPGGMAAEPVAPAPSSAATSDAGPAEGWPTDIVRTAEFDTAAAFVAKRDGDLFVTGRAGTGKSTLLRCIRESLGPGVAVLAPTGLAAVNVGGQTIHSFFGLPPRLLGPEDVRRSRNGTVMRRLETLIIDEVSMVRADLMQAIDRMLRLNRGRQKEPFGGVQMLLFGDLHQLPPVVAGAEAASRLHEDYGGPFFFNIEALRDGNCQLLELSEVFRQRDETFLRVLNAVREGEAGREELELLDGCVGPLQRLRDAGDHIILTTTNEAANRINTAFLEALPGRAEAFEATRTGEYPETATPVDSTLLLKTGARVVLIRNDPAKRWVNGTLAVVTRVEGGRAWVEIAGREHELEPVAWESLRYAYDAERDEITRTVAGTFQQLPVRLAWALTIHKAQGMTLDRVYIDFGRGTFAHGQAYVALSRCRSLEGLRLSRPLRERDIIFDPAVTAYRDLFLPLGTRPRGRLL
ncbi:MAG: AAA family ATPase [Hyphomicrobiaceae bacterium]|nr:AAA family ATPase [Hyphomicrobiaceae bacterium]